MRAMFEAFVVRRPTTTGVIQWMLNSAWPELYWQLYDYYLVPNGAFYGTRIANRLVNLVFDYGDRSIVAVNDTEEPLAEMEVQTKVFDLHSEILFDETHALELGGGALEKVLTLPEFTPDDNVYFLDLRLVDPGGELLAVSFYWLSSVEDELDWEGTEWFFTPIARFADMTALATMPETDIEVEHRFETGPDGQKITVDLSNPGDQLAFFIDLQVVGAESGRLAAPILWDDNYVSLLPVETRQIRAVWPDHALPDEQPSLRFSGWNARGK